MGGVGTGKGTGKSMCTALVDHRGFSKGPLGKLPKVCHEAENHSMKLPRRPCKLPGFQTVVTRFARSSDQGKKKHININKLCEDCPGVLL